VDEGEKREENKKIKNRRREEEGTFSPRLIDRGKRFMKKK